MSEIRYSWRCFFSMVALGASANSLRLFLCLSGVTDVFVFYTLMFNMACSWDVFQSYFYNDDIFNFNYAQAKAATGNTSEGEEVGTCCGAHLNGSFF